MGFSCGSISRRRRSGIPRAIRTCGPARPPFCPRRTNAPPSGGVIAGELAGQRGPGVTYTPITLLHATLSPGAELVLPWPADFNALVYVLSGRGAAGAERRPAGDHQLVVFGPGDVLRVGADPHQESRHPNLEILVLGGRPIREPVVHYGPFVMNTRAEIVQALEDYQAGRLGRVPATDLPHRQSGDSDVAHPEGTHPGGNGEQHG